MALISSLIITCASPQMLPQVLNALHQCPQFTIGEHAGSKIALVSEDADENEAEVSHAFILDLPHVLACNPISIYLDT